MKKLLMVLFGATMVLAACGGDSSEPAKTATPAAKTETETVSTIATEEETNLVEIVVPADFAYEIEQDADTDELFESITINTDGSISYVIEESLLDEFMPILGIEFDKLIQEIVDTYPAFQLIEYTDVYDEFDIYLDITQYDEEVDVEAIVALITLSGTYNAFAGYDVNDMSLTFNLLDEASGEKETLVYPTDF